MKPSKFLLNPVRALNFWGLGGVGAGGGMRGGGGGLSVFSLLFLFCLFV